MRPAEHPNPNPTPIITTTKIPRCTIIRNNLITENNNLTVPVNGSTGVAPWGAGVELPGDYADLVEQNMITNNPTDGVLGFEYPNPFTAGKRLRRTRSSSSWRGTGSATMCSPTTATRGGAVHRRRDARKRCRRNLRVPRIAIQEQLRERQRA